MQKVYVIREDANIYNDFHLDAESLHSEALCKINGFSNEKNYRSNLLKDSNNINQSLFKDGIWKINSKMDVDDIISSNMDMRNIILSNKLSNLLREESNLVLSNFKFEKNKVISTNTHQNIFVLNDDSINIDFEKSALENTYINKKLSSFLELHEQFKKGINYLNLDTNPYIELKVKNNLFSLMYIYTNLLFVSEKFKNLIESLTPIGIQFVEMKHIKIKEIID